VVVNASWESVDMELYMRDQGTILADILVRMRDPTNARWTTAEMYTALNDALTTWHGRVSVPNIYTIPGGWLNGDLDYTLPAYINSTTVLPQMKRTIPYGWWGQVTIDDSQTWTDVSGWTIEPDDSGGKVLRFDIPPFSSEGRVLWFGINGPVPTTVPTIGTEQSAVATTLILGSVVDCLDHGYVKVGTEWMQYSGVTRTTSTTTLGGLVRALDSGTPAAIHAVGVSVYWGVAMPRLELYRTLLDQVMVFLHELYLSDAAPRETQLHQQMVSFYQARIDKFWRTWIPARKPRMVLDRRYVLIE
jgi:hypothetical protein